ncbi:MAG: Holliday junction resolvase RuvX [Selenomonadaceae bacterium]|nr:Holliday junction resolvase RuvX [Selenomonadaceae bacterium]
MAIAAIDPGRDKCGLAVLAEDGSVLLQRVIATERLERELAAVADESDLRCLVLGNGTTCAQAAVRIHTALPNVEIVFWDEYRTTEEAKKVYWKENPPKGWRRFIPTTMQVPPCPVDDYVAVILGQRFLDEEERLQ